MVGVPTISATVEKRKWLILSPRPQKVENFFSKYGHAVIGKLLKS